jgi:hypothetical protein
MTKHGFESLSDIRNRIKKELNRIEEDRTKQQEILKTMSREDENYASISLEIMSLIQQSNQIFDEGMKKADVILSIIYAALHSKTSIDLNRLKGNILLKVATAIKIVGAGVLGIGAAPLAMLGAPIAAAYFLSKEYGEGSTAKKALLAGGKK